MFKVSFIYTDPVDHARLAGWTTSFYNNAGNIDAVIAASKVLGVQLGKCAGKQVVVSGARITDLSNPRNARSVNVPAYTPISYDTDFPTNAVHCTLYGSTLSPVGFWLRGVPDDIILRAKLIDGFPTGYKAFQALQDMLGDASQTWTIRRIPNNIATFPILNWNGLATANPQFSTGATMALAVGDRVRIQRVKGFPYLKRVWTITAADNVGFTYTIGPNYNPPAAAPVLTDKGKARNVTSSGARNVTVGEQITKLTYDYATKKNVGRPTGGLSGRQKTKR